MNDELVKTVMQSWPLAIVFLLLVFYRDIRPILANIRIDKVQLSVGGITINLSAEDIKNITVPLLEAMADTLKRDDRIYFRRIISEKKPALTVYKLFKKHLKRDKETHHAIGEPSLRMLTTLRSLRGFGLILPKKNEDERWEDDSEIEVTRFGRFVSNHPELKKLIEIPGDPEYVTEIDKMQEA